MPFLVLLFFSFFDKFQLNHGNTWCTYTQEEGVKELTSSISFYQVGMVGWGGGCTNIRGFKILYND